MSTASARCPRLLEHAELVVDLRPAGDEHERPLDVAEQPAEHLELLLEQQTRRRPGSSVRDALGRRVRPMRRSERVVHEEVPALREALAPTPGRSPSRPGRSACSRAPRSRSSGRSSADAPRPAPSRTRGRGLSAGRGASRRRRARRLALEEVAERRQRGTDARVVGDPPVLERDVQVGADEHALARDVRVANGARAVHPTARSLPIRSTSRHE